MIVYLWKSKHRVLIKVFELFKKGDINGNDQFLGSGKKN